MIRHVERSDENQLKNYYGTCKKKLQIVLQQPYSFFQKQKEKSTESSKYTWELKNNTINYDLKWSVACKAYPNTGNTTKCDLCLTEELTIMKADPESLLNPLTSQFLNADI